MKKISVEIGDVVELRNYRAKSILLVGQGDCIESTIAPPAKFEISIAEKGDKPIKGVDYFTEQDKAAIVRELYFENDIDFISNQEIDNLF